MEGFTIVGDLQKKVLFSRLGATNKKNIYSNSMRKPITNYI